MYWLRWVGVAACRLSLVAQVGATEGVACGLTCPCGILVPRPGIEPMSPALADELLTRWTTRDVPA